MEAIEKKRNTGYDSLKGIAIIFVCIGHILQSSFSDFADTNLHAFIFAVQMPLFFIISGYFGVVHEIDSKISFFQVIRKKIIVYLIPIFSRILIFDRIFQYRNITPIESLTAVFPNHIDNGLWYLWVVFFLNVSLSFASYMSSKFFNFLKGFVSETLIYLGTLIPWLAFIIFVGMSFLGAKLILYYSIFYYSGHLYRIYIENYLNEHQKTNDIIIGVFLIIGLYLVFRTEIFTTSDTLVTISTRLISGFTLSFSIIYVVNKHLRWFEKMKVHRLGKYTLEIYYVHGVAYSLLSTDNSPHLYSVNGILTLLFSILITTIFTTAIIFMIKSNPYTDFIFFGKQKPRKQNVMPDL